MFFIIVSRTARGKDTLAKALTNAGLRTQKSYSTRDPRSESDNSHHFITETDYENYQKTGQITLETSYNGKTYFFLKNQLEHCDFLILDIQGLYEITEQMPDTPFTLVYLTAENEQAKEHAIKRASDPEKAARIFDSRSDEEDHDFSMLETLLDLKDGDKNNIQPLPENITTKHIIENNYETECIEKAVDIILDIKNVNENALYITKFLMEIEKSDVDIDETGNILITFENDNHQIYTKYISPKLYSSYLLMNPKACQCAIHSLCRTLTPKQLSILTKNP